MNKKEIEKHENIDLSIDCLRPLPCWIDWALFPDRIAAVLGLVDPIRFGTPCS